MTGVEYVLPVLRPDTLKQVGVTARDTDAKQPLHNDVDQAAGKTKPVGLRHRSMIPQSQPAVLIRSGVEQEPCGGRGGGF